MSAFKNHLDRVEKTDTAEVVVVLLFVFFGLFAQTASFLVVNLFDELPIDRGQILQVLVKSAQFLYEATNRLEIM